MVQIVIPMSGIGKRFINAGYTDPKPLIEVDGKPMVAHVWELFDSPKDAIFIVNAVHCQSEENNICDFLSIMTLGHANIQIVPDEGRRGPVHAVMQIAEEINDDDEVIVSYCDFGTSWNYNSFLEESRKADGAIACYTGFHPHMLGSDNYAFVKMNGEYAAQIQEKKPFTSDKMSELASNGIYYFRSGKILKKYFQQLMDLNVTVGGEFYVSEVYNLMIQDGLKVVCPTIKHMLQWGTPHDLEIYKGWSDCFRYPIQLESPKCPEDTTLILPMAGKGSRFADEGWSVPKPFLQVDGKCMAEQAINCLPSISAKILISLKEHAVTLPTTNGYKPIYIDGVTQGQACTCEIGVKEVDPEKPILISACDNGAKYDHSHWNELVADEKADVIVWTFKNNPTVIPNPDMYSWGHVDWEDNRVTEVSTKKFPFGNYSPMKCHAIIGTFFFRKASYFSEALKGLYDKDLRTNGEFYVDDVIQECINNGLRVVAFEVDHYLCWGTPNDYRTYNYWSSYFGEKNGR